MKSSTPNPNDQPKSFFNPISEKLVLLAVKKNKATSTIETKNSPIPMTHVRSSSMKEQNNYNPMKDPFTFAPSMNDGANPVKKISDAYYSKVNEQLNPMQKTTYYGNQNYAIIIHCFNEEKSFAYQQFLIFAVNHPDVLLCFVNDTSTDNTLRILRKLQAEVDNNICILDLKNNVGKADAIRQGMLFTFQNYRMDLIGFLDTKNTSTPDEWMHMANYKEEYPHFSAVVGTRLHKTGTPVSNEENQSKSQQFFKQCVKKLLKANFQDTQCEAKIFNRSLIPILFSKPFLTNSLFNIELFFRLQKKFGKSALQKGVLEYPLMQSAKIKGAKPSIKILFQLIKLYWHYHIADNINIKKKLTILESKLNTPISNHFINK